MSDRNSLLIDIPLVADPDADEEMGANDVEAVADEDLAGSRLLLVRRQIEAIDLEGSPAGIVQFACTFQPAANARFTSAQFRLRLSEPAGLKVIDLAPSVLDDPAPVEITLDHKGSLGLKVPSLLEIGPSFESGSSLKYHQYHCSVHGSGVGTNLVRWDFRENPDKKAGIGREQVLTLTLPATGSITGSIIVSARLARPALRAGFDAIRDLIAGKKDDDRTYPVAFDIPPVSSRERLARFLNLI
jgi:hypothetical protein